MTECPKCKCQLEVKLTFASGPKKATLHGPGNRIGEMLDEAHSKDLNPWEQEFIDTLQTRYDEYGERVKLSDKQLGTLQNIAGK